MRSIYRSKGLSLLVAGCVVAGQAETPDEKTSWANIPISPTIEWTPCYNDKTDCARLEVPMNYEEPDGAKVALAVIRRRATSKKDYKGPVLFNTGGPNNSGVDWMNEPGWADLLHEAVGFNHDLVTWDPRSYSHSTPRISCWANEQRRNLWAATSPGLIIQYDDLAYIATHQHRADVENSACMDMMGEYGILEHVSTTHTARDLHALMEALGQDRLRYVGQSYGCVLATYFASMFPDKIERVVCDGNGNPNDLVSGDFVTKPTDVDLLLDYFFEVCAAEEQCALHESTPDKVRERYESILENARLNPVVLPIQSPFDYAAQLPTYSLAVGVMGSAIGNPYSNFPQIARTLAYIESGGGDTAEDLLASTAWPSASDFNDTEFRSPDDPDAGPTGFFDKYPLSEDWTACNDLPPVSYTIEEMQALVEKAASHVALDAVRLGSLLNCNGRTVRAEGQYTGPFGGNTSHPILFTNARVDPSTSVRYAYENQKMFAGSGLLVYENYGHSVMFNSPCVVKHVKAYFQEGTLPSDNVKCEDEIPIDWSSQTEED